MRRSACAEAALRTRAEVSAVTWIAALTEVAD